MKDNWKIFPTVLGENSAWISFNHDFTEVAEQDSRYFHLQVRVAFRIERENGLPTNEEFPALSAIDESLDDAVAELGGVYVGRLTTGGYRYFYYYLED